MLITMRDRKRYGYVNLNLYAKDFREKRWKGKPNPLNDPRMCACMVDDCHAELGLHWSYGGWMEDRPCLWEGSYLQEKQTFLHLGVDFNAPTGSLVEADYPMEVLHIIKEDPPMIGGWGTMVVARLLHENIVLVYAHLDSEVLCFEKETLEAGARFAQIGHHPENGNWHPHLHLQAIDGEFFDSPNFDLTTFDGYGHIRDRQGLARLFPDPLRFWKF